MTEPDTRMLMACRAFNIDDYDPMQRAMWDKVVAEQGGVTIPDYEGRIAKPCEVCGVDVQVGPRQQEALKHLSEFGAQIVCLVCVPVVMQEMQAAEGIESVALYNLNNPQP